MPSSETPTPATVSIIQNAGEKDSPFVYNTAVCAYFGDVLDTGTALFMLDVCNAANENAGFSVFENLESFQPADQPATAKSSVKGFNEKILPVIRGKIPEKGIAE